MVPRPLLLLAILGVAISAVPPVVVAAKATDLDDSRAAARAARAAVPIPGVRRHLSRRRRDLSSSPHSPAIASRQVQHPREALERWEQRDEVELARRATPSNTPAVCKGTVTAYSQCGGQNWAQDTCCVAGFSCVYSNEYYSQCLPVASSSTPSSSSSTSSAAAPTQTAAAYGQCGGIGSTPALCPSGFTCATMNDYYSQCVPQAAATHSSSSSIASTTSTSPAPTQTAAAFGQCGGLGAAPQLCPSGYYCDQTNTYYFQCLPSQSSSVAASGSASKVSSSSSSSSAAAPLQTAIAYGQCGGNGASLALCPAGWYCDTSNAYYFQCLPQSLYAPSSTSSSPSPPSSSSAPAAPASSSSRVSSAGPSIQSVPSSTQQATPTASSKVSSSSTATSLAALQTAATYGQCGGLGASLSLCPSGWYCAVVNDYYWQCLPASASTLALSTAPTTTATSFSTVTRSASSALSTQASSTLSAPSSSASVNTCPTSNAWAQCDGFLWLSKVCCPANYYCQYQSMFYSQCVPGTGSTPSAAMSSTKASSSSASSSVKVSTTSSSTAPSATPSQTCNKNSGGSDGCTPYGVSWSGVTLPSGSVFADGGHVNYQAIPKSQYKPGQTYLTSGNGWTPQSFGVHFESLNNQPSGIYIGRNFYDWGLAAQAFPSGYCIIWVQVDVFNQHFGEGGQTPICTP